jgi:hypothetical protein
MSTQATIVVEPKDEEARSLFTRDSGSPDFFLELLESAFTESAHGVEIDSVDLKEALLPSGSPFSSALELLDKPHSVATPNRYDIFQTDAGWNVRVRTAAVDLNRPDPFGVAGYLALEPERDVVLFEGPIRDFQAWVKAYDPDSDLENERFLELSRKVATGA